MEEPQRPEGRNEAEDHYIDLLFDNLPPEVWDMVEPCLSKDGTVEITGAVEDARVVVTFGSVTGNRVVVENDRYLQGADQVSAVEIKLRP